MCFLLLTVEVEIKDEHDNHSCSSDDDHNSCEEENADELDSESSLPDDFEVGDESDEIEEYLEGIDSKKPDPSELEVLDVPGRLLGRERRIESALDRIVREISDRNKPPESEENKLGNVEFEYSSLTGSLFKKRKD